MNKKLIALAVAGACAAPAAMAQTTNPVTLYGLVYVTFESVEANGGPSTATPFVRRNRVSDQSSLFGIRGTEDLGGGLKAFFQLETGFKPDENNTTFAARNSGVGLQGNFGSILLGRWDTPFKTTTTAVDPFGDRTIGGIQAGMQGSGIITNPSGNAASVANPPGGFDGFDRRDQNVIQYWSPTWAGVQVRLSYSANEGKSSVATATAPANVNPNASGASITWTGGPVYVGLAYDELKDFRPSFVFPAGVTALPATVVLPKQTASAAFGTFTIGPVKLGALYEEIKRDAPSVIGTTAGSVKGFSKEKSWMGNVTWTIGNNQLLYQYSNSKDGGASIVTSATVTARVEPDCKVHSVGYQYNFSRRTFFLGQYIKVDNNDSASCNFGSNRLAIVAGQDPKGVSLGIRHIF